MPVGSYLELLPHRHRGGVRVYPRISARREDVNSLCPKYGQKAATAVSKLLQRRYLNTLADKEERFRMPLYPDEMRISRTKSRRSRRRSTEPEGVCYSPAAKKAIAKHHRRWDSAIFRSAWRRPSIPYLTTRRSWDVRTGFDHDCARRLCVRGCRLCGCAHRCDHDNAGTAEETGGRWH